MKLFFCLYAIGIIGSFPALWAKKPNVLFIMADDLGCDSILHLIVTFNGSKEVGSDLQLRNLLAWWACEDVCREIIAEKDNEERAAE